MKFWQLKELPSLNGLRIGVIGHVEWVNFLYLDNLPKGGKISHAKKSIEEPAGGGALVAVQLAKLTGQKTHFFTSLGRDEIGNKSCKRLEELGLELHIAWRDTETRRGISMIDSRGERAITVIGERLHPTLVDKLPWHILSSLDGIFITATDENTLRYSRGCSFIAVTPRLNLELIKRSKIIIDALIGSGLDPDENVEDIDLTPNIKLRIATEGPSGGFCQPGGKFRAAKLVSPLIDTYGCGDCFAAGVTAGLSAGWTKEKAVSLGAHCGAMSATYFGPYN